MGEAVDKFLNDQVEEHVTSAVCTALGLLGPEAAFGCVAGVTLKKFKDAADQDFVARIRKVYHNQRINLAAPVAGGLSVSDKELQARADHWGGTIWRDRDNAFWHPDTEFPLPKQIPDLHIFRGLGPVCSVKTIKGRRNKYPGSPTLRAR